MAISSNPPDKEMNNFYQAVHNVNRIYPDKIDLNCKTFLINSLNIPKEQSHRTTIDDPPIYVTLAEPYMFY